MRPTNTQGNAEKSQSTKEDSMEITEEKIYSAFGLNPEGANDPEPADPDDQVEETPAAEGEEETEPADPDEAAAEEDNLEEDAEDEDGGDAGQPLEERRANAARRRQQERQAAIDAAVQQERERLQQENEANMQAFFQRAGLVNPFTKKPITNMQEFNEWKTAQEDARIQQELQSGKLTTETLQQLIERSPVVQQARAAAEQQQREAEAQQAQQFERDVQTQLAEIQKADPSIRELADLMHRPWSAAFYEAVKRGNNFKDAYFLATRELTQAQTAAAAKQQAINNIKSKDHLRRTGVGGKPGATVTEAERRLYKVFNPGVTDDQIQAFQNKVKKG